MPRLQTHACSTMLAACVLTSSSQPSNGHWQSCHRLGPSPPESSTAAALTEIQDCVRGRGMWHKQLR